MKRLATNATKDAKGLQGECNFNKWIKESKTDMTYFSPLENKYFWLLGKYHTPEIVKIQTAMRKKLNIVCHEKCVEVKTPYGVKLIAPEKNDGMVEKYLYCWHLAFEMYVYKHYGYDFLTTELNKKFHKEQKPNIIKYIKANREQIELDGGFSYQVVGWGKPTDCSIGHADRIMECISRKHSLWSQIHMLQRNASKSKYS